MVTAIMWLFAVTKYFKLVSSHGQRHCRQILLAHIHVQTCYYGLSAVWFVHNCVHLSICLCLYVCLCVCMCRCVCVCSLYCLSVWLSCWRARTSQWWLVHMSVSICRDHSFPRQISQNSAGQFAKFRGSPRQKLLIPRQPIYMYEVNYKSTNNNTCIIIHIL